MAPATLFYPKEVLPIGCTPIIYFIIDEAIDADIEEIIIISNKNKQLLDKIVLDHCNKLGLKVNIIYQDKPKGLGHAILCAKDLIKNNPFAVILPDNIIYNDNSATKQLINIYNKHGNSIIGVQGVPKSKVINYGIIDPIYTNNRRLYYLNNVVEKPEAKNSPSNMAIMGRYIFTPNIFDFLNKVKPDHKGEIQLTDAIRELNKSDSVQAYTVRGKWYDTGNPSGYIETILGISLHHKDLKDGLLRALKGLTLHAK